MEQFETNKFEICNKMIHVNFPLLALFIFLIIILYRKGLHFPIAYFLCLISVKGIYHCSNRHALLFLSLVLCCSLTYMIVFVIVTFYSKYTFTLKIDRRERSPKGEAL